MSMNTVEPIRNEKQIQKMKDYLKSQNIRDWLLFVMGCNTGLRISDLVSLRMSSIIDNRIYIREQKTGKERVLVLNKNVLEAISEYKSRIKYSPDTYIFKSRVGANRPITRAFAWSMLNQAARKCGIKNKIGTHTLRKTFGYHAWKGGTPIEVLQRILNHSSQRITMVYLGINQDMIEEVYLNLNI